MKVTGMESNETGGCSVQVEEEKEKKGKQEPRGRVGLGFRFEGGGAASPLASTHPLSLPPRSLSLSPPSLNLTHTHHGRCTLHPLSYSMSRPRTSRGANGSRHSTPPPPPSPPSPASPHPSTALLLTLPSSCDAPDEVAALVIDVRPSPASRSTPSSHLPPRSLYTPYSLALPSTERIWNVQGRFRR